MSEMSYLEKLLDGVEVEWKAVGDIAGYSTTKVDADKLDATLFVGVDNLLADKGGRIDATYQPNTARLTAYEPGDLLLGNIRPYLKKVWMAENNGGCSGDVLAIRILADCKKIISPEYLYYALSSDSFFSYSMQHAKGAKMPRGSKDAILNYQIPIPCPSAPGKSLAIQSEIVRILDKFTALTAELTAELTMRKKQYNYYRDQLLSFEEGDVEWKTLGEISRKISSGGTPKTGVTEYYDGTIPWLRTQEVDFREIWDTEIKITEEGLKTSSAKWIPKDCIIIAMYGATVGKIGINKIPMTTNQACANIQLDEEIVHYRYVFHFLCSQYAYIKSLGTGSQTNINAQIVKNIKIPVPFAENPEKSLNEQLRIVNILDKFDTLTSSITEGLPREIELRQKQYEYYRDLLFSFPRPETASN
ncbi:restriction endonuclease subunit S (plasmid) [Klebsiella oxytoca]|uniref:restriction endonuclease subunit S n=1 Tax=Klebsiella oxytoca TaxID=571 RepID=UPI003DA75486